MNIYLIYQSDNIGYDTYDSAVVVAKSAAAARKIHPNGRDVINKPGYNPNGDWANIKNVEVEYLGKAAKDRKAGEVICASFNAG